MRNESPKTPPSQDAAEAFCFKSAPVQYAYSYPYWIGPAIRSSYIRDYIVKSNGSLKACSSF